jgi:hypothetical protein
MVGLAMLAMLVMAFALRRLRLARGARCQVRVDRLEIRVNGQPSSAGGAAMICRAGGAMAEVQYTGDAIYGDVAAVIEALRAAAVPTLVRTL